MKKSLQQSINQRIDVESQIRSAIQTPMKRDKLWIVTESDYDRSVYERFFNENVEVRPAYDEKGKGGCDRVALIVNNILKTRNTQRILGIRDADYMYYVSYRFHDSENIYHTDERDIEMMMFKAPSVLESLEASNVAFTAKIKEVKNIACYMGLIRIWHVAKSITASLKKFSLSIVWNQQARPQQIKSHWKRLLIDRYNQLTGEHLNPKRLSSFKNRRGLDERQYGRICRGHDFVQLLGMAMVDSNYGREFIEMKIAAEYSKADFAATNLAQGIRTFARRFGMEVIVD